MSTEAHADRISEVSKKFGITPEDYMLPARHMINLLNPDGTLRPEDQQGTEPGHEYPLPTPARGGVA